MIPIRIQQKAMAKKPIGAHFLGVYTAVIGFLVVPIGTLLG